MCKFSGLVFFRLCIIPVSGRERERDNVYVSSDQMREPRERGKKFCAEKAKPVSKKYQF